MALLGGTIRDVVCLATALCVLATLGCADAPPPKKKKATASTSSDGTTMKKLTTDAPPAFANSADAINSPVDPLGLLQAQITWDETSKEISAIRFPAEITLKDGDLEHVKNATEMTHLEIYNARELSGAGLANLKDMKKLQRLYIHNSAITDAGLASFPELPELVWLQIDHSQIAGPGLTNLKGKLPKVRDMWLRWAQITGPGVNELQALPKLEHLYLGWSKVDDAGLASFKDLTQLTFLELRDTMIKGPGVENLKALTNLIWLDLQNTGVDGASVAPLVDLVKLKTLDLNGTRTSDENVGALKSFGVTWLGVKGSKVTPAGVAELKKMLPNANIDSQ
jgi:hypothetical protein